MCGTSCREVPRHLSCDARSPHACICVPLRLLPGGRTLRKRQMRPACGGMPGESGFPGLPGSPGGAGRAEAQTSSSSPTGQWSEPITSISIHASRTAPRNSSETKK
ncbi:hypothetical protein DDE01_01480 [Desulfovibrio desulfuricans]|nr:hypothetical protein DDE01_01480 [Desulfovibrio desulfuricans]